MTQPVTRLPLLLEDLAAARRALDGVLQELTDETWLLPVHGEAAGWTVLDVIRHLMDVHEFQRGQLGALLAGQPTVGPAFDLDAWNQAAATRHAALQRAALIARLADSHTGLLALLAGLPERRLAQPIYHFALRETVPLARYIALIGFHERLHADDIRRAVA